MLTKLCSRCGPTVGPLPVEAFNVGTALHNRNSYCRSCMHAYQRAQREAAGAEDRHDYAVGRPLRPDELVRCQRCGLRGKHECIEAATTGIGQWGWT